MVPKRLLHFQFQAQLLKNSWALGAFQAELRRSLEKPSGARSAGGGCLCIWSRGESLTLCWGVGGLEGGSCEGGLQLGRLQRMPWWVLKDELELDARTKPGGRE